MAKAKAKKVELEITQKMIDDAEDVQFLKFMCQQLFNQAQKKKKKEPNPDRKRSKYNYFMSEQYTRDDIKAIEGRAAKHAEIIRRWNEQKEHYEIPEGFAFKAQRAPLEEHVPPEDRA
jgi:hypothetical protein